MASLTERLVPSDLGGVDSYAVTDTNLYVITVLGTKKLVKCPLAGCSTSPDVIDSSVSAGGAPKRDVEATSAGVFWIQTDLTLKAANLEGGNVATAHSLISGQIYLALRGLDANLFFGYDDGTLGQNGVMQLAGGAAQPVAGVAGYRYVRPVIAAGGGRLAVWQHSQPISMQPIQLKPIGGSAVTTVGAATDIPYDGLVLAGDYLFWVDDDGGNTLYGCPVSNCSPWSTVDTGVGGSITTDGTLLFYTKVGGGTGNVLSCPAIAAANGTCTPTIQASDFWWTGARRLRVNATSIYGIDQSWNSVWRSPRVN